jgi:rhodanese-related sulfurtransferase
MRKKFTDLIEEVLPNVQEIFPWDLEEKMQNGEDMMLLDIREPYEFDPMHIQGSINVPRGILETACDWGYDETVPELAAARDKEIIVICRSGNRSVLACFVMQLMGYRNVISLKTGLRGWVDYELPLVGNEDKEVDIDEADEFFATKVRADQMEAKE